MLKAALQKLGFFNAPAVLVGVEDSEEIVKDAWWYKDYGRHVNGDFSMAVIQANTHLEDQSQVESGSLSLVENGPQGTFVGIYDGHAGPEAATFVNDHLFNNIKRFISESEEISADVIRNAYLAIEEEFLTVVRNEWLSDLKMATVGACCLTGIICNGVMYIANAGDSRAVLGTAAKRNNALRVSAEHNVSYQSVRNELYASHSLYPNIVVKMQGVWRVRGLIQISRSIGDAYLKDYTFSRHPLPTRFRQPLPFDRPILKAEPAIYVQELTPQDQFIIFASDGLWEHLSNEEAVDMVKRSSRKGIARKLVKAALKRAAKRSGIGYSDIMRLGSGQRRNRHDDITVIVLFLSQAQSASGGPVLSVKSPVSY